MRTLTQISVTALLAVLLLELVANPAVAAGANLVSARAGVTGSGRVDYSAGQVDAFTLKIALRGARPNFRYDIWLNMDGTGFFQQVGPAVSIVTDGNGNARNDNLRATHRKQPGCEIDGCRDTHTLSLLLEDDPLNDNFAPLDPTLIAFQQSPAVVSVQGRH